VKLKNGNEREKNPLGENHTRKLRVNLNNLNLKINKNPTIIVVCNYWIEKRQSLEKYAQNQPFNHPRWTNT